jgi:hypothetical protein
MVMQHASAAAAPQYSAVANGRRISDGGPSGALRAGEIEETNAGNLTVHRYSREPTSLALCTFVEPALMLK